MAFVNEYISKEEEKKFIKPLDLYDRMDGFPSPPYTWTRDAEREIWLTKLCVWRPEMGGGFHAEWLLYDHGRYYEFFLDDSYLDIEEFTYEYEFEEFDEDGEEYEEDVFRPCILTKIGGSGMTAKGDQYYDQLTKREVDGIVKEFIQEALGLTDFEVTTESDDFSI